ncbi:MAG: hypothetical protein K2N94_08820 [Lachnospiraceae bacterium]|nr:hypothetical protein [Lachnospiraceae bacterium]
MEYIRKTALPELKKGNAVYGNILQRVFLLAGEQELQAEIAAAYEELLRRISAKKLIRLSEEYRNYYDGWYAEDYALDWSLKKPQREEFPYLTDGGYHAVLKLGTFMGCGYDRQWCMEALDGAEGSLPFFFLRLNDWVGAIRESAFHLAKKRLQQCGVEELFSALPMLEKVRASERRSEEHIRLLEEIVRELGLKKLREIPDTTLRGRLPYYEVNVKNAVYRLLSQNRVLELSQMEQLLSAEWTGYGKQLLLTGIFRHYGYDKERVERYLNSGSTLVRYRALLFCYESEQNAWPGLERMLLDRSRRVRSNVSYILEKHTDIRVLDCYLEELQREMSGPVSPETEQQRELSGPAVSKNEQQREMPDPVVSETGQQRKLSGPAVSENEPQREMSSPVVSETGQQQGVSGAGSQQKVVSTAVLLGIGEHGAKKEIGIVMPFLESEDGLTAKAALTAYGRLAAEEGELLYWRFLFDSRPMITKTAYRLIRKYELHYGAERIYNEFCRRRSTLCGNYLFRLLLCEPSWERLPYLLMLYGEGELSPEESQKAWNGIRRRYAYAAVSAERAQTIREALERAGEKIPEQLRKNILFDLSHVARG